MNSISQNLKNIRTEKNLTQTRMADLLGVTQRTVSNWEKGKTMPSPDVLQSVANKLGVNVNCLLYGRQPQKEKGYLQLFIIFVTGFVLAEVINFLRPDKSMLNPADANTTRIYNMMAFPLLMFCYPMVYIPPRTALTKYLRSKYITKETVFSKHSHTIHKILLVFLALYTGFYGFTFLYWYVLPDTFRLEGVVQSIWQLLFLSDGKIPLIFGGLLWGLGGSVPKTIENTLNNTNRKNTIAVNLKKLRLENNLTQQQMANKLFVTQQTISNWEQGKAMPDISQLMDIADKTSTDIYRLMYASHTAENNMKKLLSAKITVSVILCILWLMADGTIFRSLPALQPPVTSKTAMLYFSSISLRSMAKKAVITPLLFFMLPGIITDYLKMKNALSVKTFGYAGVVKFFIGAFMIFYITGLVPVLGAELKEAVRLYNSNIWFNFPDISLPARWQGFSSFVATAVAHNHPMFFSILGFAYSYCKKSVK